MLSYRPAVAENQPENKHRMNPELSSFAVRLRAAIYDLRFTIYDFPARSLELFALQFNHNPVYQKICRATGASPERVEYWTQIPAVPTGLFKELELTPLAPGERTAVFYSSGTTEQKPGRHFHCADSLALYETSLWEWFQQNCGARSAECGVVCLTPPPESVPNSSLVHMFETVRQKFAASKDVFTGKNVDGIWTLDFDATLARLNSLPVARHPPLILGTAFSFVHLLDFLAEKDLRLQLPENTRVMETGGYKNRSRSMPKAELHGLIEKFLGVPRENIICEYGMSELSSQAYAGSAGVFHFPPWARVHIISPETGREVADGETGLIRIFDLANVFSVAAVQTEDLGIRRGDGFELIGRAQLAEPRGCSLMTA
jgi:hypothetical protein